MSQLIHFGSPEASVPAVHDIPLPKLEKRKKTKKNKKRVAKAIEAAQHDAVVHPSHYNRHKVEVIDLVEEMDFNRGSIVKYVVRAGHKPGGDELQDLNKALWLLEREIERVKNG